MAILFAFERFNQYLHGRDTITVSTDHKPLVPIFTKSYFQGSKTALKNDNKIAIIQPQGAVVKCT